MPAIAGDIRDPSLVPESGRSPGAGHGNPPQYSCLENPMHRGAWWATIQGEGNGNHSSAMYEIDNLTI